MSMPTITDLLSHLGGGLSSVTALVVALLTPLARARKIRAASPQSVLNAAGASTPRPAWDAPRRMFRKPAAKPPEEKDAPPGKKFSWKWKRKPKDTSPRDLKRFFRHEMRRFRSAVGGRRHIYDYPWFLMLGQEGRPRLEAGRHVADVERAGDGRAAGVRLGEREVRGHGGVGDPWSRVEGQARVPLVGGRYGNRLAG